MNLLRTLDPSNAGFPNGIRFATALALTLAWIAPAAFSQDSSWLEEVVVTAQKRAESV